MTFYTEYHVNFTEFSSGQRAHTKHPDTQFTAIILMPGS